MQQTETLKLNLIEGTDTVDPAPINQNMVALEEEAAAIREEMAVLAENLGSGGQTCRIAWGSYTGTGTSGSSGARVLEVDFKPVFLYLINASSSNYFHALRPAGRVQTEQSDKLVVSWGDNSVSWYSTASSSAASAQFNNSGTSYYYIILGVDE